MRLYHYLETKWALDDIRRRRLKLAIISEMNDPYESRSVCSDHDLTRSALERTIEQGVQRYAALCFSLSRNNILMWSHYAEKHKGMCLGFEVPEERTRPVEYLPEIQAIENMIVETPVDFKVEQGEKVVGRLLGAKYEGWSYEQEVRVHVPCDEKDEETGQYFVNFNEGLVLREVIAGARFSFSRKVIEDALAGYSGRDDVQIVKARPLSSAYQIVIDEKGF
jgi:hypothetical protein